MDFRITGLSPEPFKPLFAKDAAALARLGAHCTIADDATSFPCRVSMAHAVPGEELILLSYEHQDAHSPYRATGPIYVRKAATSAYDGFNVVPEPVRARLLSVRAYDDQDLIVVADVVDGSVLETLIGKFFEHEEVAYLHLHYARRGCYACRVDRVC
ncbi:MAG: DUF1203 domain-containing protein [Betaproteobacteria bacterium]